MVQSPGDLIGLVTHQKKPHGLHAVCLAGADVLLLSPAGDLELAAAQGLDIADDGTHSAVKQTERQVLIAEQPSLVACLSSQAQDAGAAQALDSVSDADLKILLAGVEG